MNQSILFARSLVATAVFCSFVGVGTARTFVIPHVLETSGRATLQPYSFDTELTFTKVTDEGSSSNSPAQVQLYLYDNSGAVMTGATGPVCNPCTFALTRNNEQVNVAVDQLIVANGGGFRGGVQLGYGVIETEGNVLAECRLVNSLNTSSNLSGYYFNPKEISLDKARAYVVPHILEKQGTTASTQFTFDTTVYMVYQPSSPDGSGATAELYLYDETGQPMTSQSGQAVCNPCQFQMGNGSPRKLSVRIDDLIVGAGGFDNSVKTGFAVLLTGGSDPDGVAMQGFVVNSHTSAFDLSVFGFEPQPIAAEARAFVLPHVLESAGTTDQAFTFDTTVFATYTGGLVETEDGGGAAANLYLYDNLGQPMLGADFTPVCNPCTFNLSSSSRKQSIRIDDLIAARGGFATGVKVGFGVVEVTGDGADQVALQGFVVNSHTGPFDLSVFGFEPQPIAAAARMGPPPTRKTFVLPHVLEREGRIVNQQNTFDTTIFITYSSLPSTPLVGATFADVYLFDADGQPLRGAKKPVCAPCSYQLTGPTQKLSLSVDELVNQAGGFDGPVKRGHAIVVVSGSDPDAVNIQGFVVNSHTSAFDLSVFGFEPQEVKSSLRLIPYVSPTIQSNSLVLSWSTNSPGYLVEQSGTLGGGWSPGGVPTVVGREYHVTNVFAGTNVFFRLRQP